MQAWAPERVDLFQLGWCDCQGYRDAVAVLLRRNLNNFLLAIYWRFSLSAWLVVSACRGHSTCALINVLFCSDAMKNPLMPLPLSLSQINLGDTNIKSPFRKDPISERFQNKIHKRNFILLIVLVQYILQDWKVNIHKPYSVGRSNSCLGIASKSFSSSWCTLNCNVKTSMYFNFFFVHTCRKPMQPFSFLN